MKASLISHQSTKSSLLCCPLALSPLPDLCRILPPPITVPLKNSWCVSSTLYFLPLPLDSCWKEDVVAEVASTILDYGVKTTP